MLLQSLSNQKYFVSPANYFQFLFYFLIKLYQAHLLHQIFLTIIKNNFIFKNLKISIIPLLCQSPYANCLLKIFISTSASYSIFASVSLISFYKCSISFNKFYKFSVFFSVFYFFISGD